MPRYKKISGSTSLLRTVERDGRRVRERIEVEPGDVIECEEHELRNFADQFECLDSESAPEEKTRPEADLKIIQRRGKNDRPVPWYDVINVATGEPINSRALKKTDAEELVR